MSARTTLAGLLAAMALVPVAAAEEAALAPIPRAHRAGATRVPAANFLVEWRLQPADARPSPRGDIVITSGSAVTGTSGFGQGAVVVGTARAAPPQALRVANGREGSIRFDRSETHTVYDMSWSAAAAAGSSTSGASQSGGSVSASRSAGTQSHEVLVHQVDGLRVTPHWTRGDSLEVDIELTHAAPAAVSRSASPDARASRDIDFHSTVQASFDEWLTVASVGEGGDELQIRVTWR